MHKEMTKEQNAEMRVTIISETIRILHERKRRLWPIPNDLDQFFSSAGELTILTNFAHSVETDQGYRSDRKSLGEYLVLTAK